MAQSDKMGRYLLYGYYNRRPAYQHESGLDYLFYAEGESPSNFSESNSRHETLKDATIDA